MLSAPGNNNKFEFDLSIKVLVSFDQKNFLRAQQLEGVKLNWSQIDIESVICKSASQL